MSNPFENRYGITNPLVTVIWVDITSDSNWRDPKDYDKETLDHKDTETNEPKRGRGRPAGSKSGARKITGTSKLYK